MAMTREEAILEFETMLAKYAFEANEAQAIGKAFEALRPVSRERVEKVWKGEWKIINTFNGCTPDQDCVCSKCVVSGIPSKAFCDACGAPMTDEAVDMMLERWKEALE